ncbi:type II toxin-antitoxin system prevent-host-death family antitoxin [Blastococcus sp. KM273128]|uniref:type II toxin-antitoxin system Phd/YefM family antitoxin n=1 Tax=Blastococcus sp. KM273128 TaxID=2570314 RepID=UPI001F023C42|nr:type II toxin-antitoxin system prevent-host-death family antitoxin [Blastococcus sp. KM273128]MCF6745872.1 type II toxin-antitoxin system prevent-host-death family antitoxin [Blastococcus sp. KM273128]
MTTIGIRELQDRLVEHIATVAAGATITVTDHGRPVARIAPVDEPTALERLVAEGVVQPPRKRKGPLPEPMRTTGTVSDLVAEQRG